MPACKSCLMVAANPHSGAVHMRCVDCCARLVLKGHPDKGRAAAALAAIALHPGVPTRAEILARVAELLKGRGATP